MRYQTFEGENGYIVLGLYRPQNGQQGLPLHDEQAVVPEDDEESVVGHTKPNKFALVQQLINLSVDVADSCLVRGAAACWVGELLH